MCDEGRRDHMYVLGGPACLRVCGGMQGCVWRGCDKGSTGKPVRRQLEQSGEKMIQLSPGLRSGRDKKQLNSRCICRQAELIDGIGGVRGVQAAWPWWGEEMLLILGVL